jgi:hypothetical protein
VDPPGRDARAFVDDEVALLNARNIDRNTVRVRILRVDALLPANLLNLKVGKPNNLFIGSKILFLCQRTINTPLGAYKVISRGATPHV